CLKRTRRLNCSRIARHYRVKRGSFAIVGLDTGDAELYKFFGGQRARVEGGIEVSDRRPIQINVCRRRRADIPQKQGSHKRDSSPGIHFILRNGEPLTSIGLCTTIREPYTKGTARLRHNQMSMTLPFGRNLNASYSPPRRGGRGARAR